MPSSAARTLMEDLRQQLEALVDRLSKLADAKRMYGSVRPGPPPPTAAAAAVRQVAPEGPGSVAEPTLPGGAEPPAAGGAGSGDASSVGAERQPTQLAGGPTPGGQQLDCGDEGGEMEVLLRRADECSARMLGLLADEPHAATSHQPLRGAALLAAALAAFMRGGTSDAAVGGLQAAVKLRPLNPTAWNCLAHSYWERGDLFMAGCCLTSGLRHSPSVAAHQMMSLLVRQQGGAAGASLLQPKQPSQQQTVNPGRSGSSGAAAAAAAAGAASGGAGSLPTALTASLAHARRALEMDLENGYSWYVLAMAQMADYFRGDHHPPGLAGGPGAGAPGTAAAAAAGGPGGARGRGRGELHRVLAAFAQAERCGCADLPDLYYNRAALHAFTQDFAAALQDYHCASSLDPGLPALAQMESLVVLLGQLTGLVAARGGVRDQHWAAVTALLAEDAARGSEVLPRTHHERLSLQSLRGLQPGSNRGLAVLCRPLVFVSPPLNASGTLYLVCVDTGGCCFVLALTHIHHDAFDMTQLLAVVHPEMRRVEVSWPPPPPPPPPPRPTPLPPPPAPSTGSSGPGAAREEAASVPPPAAAPEAAAAAAAAAAGGGSRTYRFPLLLVGCDPGCRSSVLVDGVPLHQAAQTPVLHHVMRAA